MAITGTEWQSLTLGQLVPQLDPTIEGSFANQMQDSIANAQKVVNDSAKKVRDIVDQVNVTLDSVAQLNTDVGNLQKDIEDLISNARNTGIHLRLLGLNSRINSVRVLQEAVQAAFFEEEDSNRPDFIGDTSVVGGIVFVVGAANPLELQDELFRLGTIFPIIRDVVGPRLTIPGAELVDVTVEEKEAGLLKQKTQGLQQELVTLADFSLGDPPKKEDLFDVEAESPSFTETLEQATEDLKAGKWIAAGLADIIPQFDHTIPNTVADFIVKQERKLTGALTAGISGVANLNVQVDRALNLINETNDTIQQLSTNVNDLIQNLSQTGIFAHLYGLDGSLNNNGEMINAINASLVDPDDPNKPAFKGDTAYLGAAIMVFGTGNPLGLQDQFERLSSTFKGLTLNLKGVVEKSGDLLNG